MAQQQKKMAGNMQVQDFPQNTPQMQQQFPNNNMMQKEPSLPTQNQPV